MQECVQQSGGSNEYAIQNVENNLLRFYNNLQQRCFYNLCQRHLQEIISPHSGENSKVNVFSVSCNISVTLS